jgi:hypothetical protein
MAMPVFDESIQAFVISKDDSSFYMDIKGVYDMEFNKIKWSDRVMRVAVVRPYLIGFLPNSIEIKCIFNPNRVVQKVELLQSQILRHTTALNSRELDSLYVLVARKHTPIRVLLKLSQIDPRLQVYMLIERKLYSTGLKIFDFLLENNFEGASSGLDKEQYVKLQKEKGFYNFIVKRRFAIAKEIFKEYKVPLSHVIMLFAELYPEAYIKNMISKFDVKVKDIPYHELLILSSNTRHESSYTKKSFDNEKKAAMREFLTFFLKKREEILSKIEDLRALTSNARTNETRSFDNKGYVNLEVMNSLSPGEITVIASPYVDPLIPLVSAEGENKPLPTVPTQ